MLPEPAAPGPEAAARLFAALGDPTRLALVTALTDGEAKSITELAALLPISRQGVTKHLRVLGAAGVLRAEPQGREVLWRGNPEALVGAQAYLDRVAASWDAALGRLKLLVETPEGNG